MTGGIVNMNGIGQLIYALDRILDTPRKRHITGGILLSLSGLLGGLAFTVLSIKNEENEYYG